MDWLEKEKQEKKDVEAVSTEVLSITIFHTKTLTM